MSIKPVFSILFAGLLSSHSVCAEEIINTYKNQYGSVLKIAKDTDNRIHGTFTTAVASPNCQKTIGLEKPLMGYQINNALSFVVPYPDCKSVVTFTGHINTNNELVMTAMIARQPVEPGKKEFNETVISQNVFAPVKHA